MKKIAVVVSTPMVAKFFLMNHLNALASRYDVTLISNLNYGTHYLKELPSNVRVLNVKITREINIFWDVIALFKLIKLFYCNDYDLVHSVSPKAGLLSMIASWITGVKHRLHFFTGQVWVTSRGFKRRLLIYLDKIIARCSSLILIDSLSQRNFLLKNNIVSKDKSLVLANGSISGVNLTKFKVDPVRRGDIRKTLNIQEDVFVFLYVGRLKKDKGVFDLADAYSVACKQIPNSLILFVGPDEESAQQKIQKSMSGSGCEVKFVPYTETPEYYMASADVFCLTSYREGFGSTVIEAAACGLPAIATNIYGLVDAVVDGVTGILVTPGEIEELSTQLIRIASDLNLRTKLSTNAHQRAVMDFDQDHVTNELLSLYADLLRTE